jgi:class 3 adenylate cyclase/tetratricopeptide (TPR) repeat protein
MALGNSCPKCTVENAPDAKFCSQCGASLDSPAGRGAKAETRESGLGAERRHLTVLFCDLVGSTELTAQLDPEEWREVVAGYHRAATENITRFAGYVALYLGDGVMAYFGWPKAHENDAERAARAGLAIVEAISTRSTSPKISVRVGIDSGSVVVGASAGKGADVFGETPNIAARVQTAAAPNTVLITGATHRLLSGLFVVEELGAQQLRGVANPVELYRVLRPTGVRGRIAAAGGLTPFVGREEELRLLLSRWERARQGQGQLVLVVGEAGIGKSRLVAEFHDRIRDTPHIWMESAGEQFFENTPFHAITEMLSQWLELQGGTKPDDRLERLDRALESAGLKPEQAAALIADLLQLPARERYSVITLNAEQRRRRLLAALTGWIYGAAKLQPVVMVIEDLHGVDPSTLELLRLLAEQGVMVPLMLICTARPEFHSEWPMRSHHTQITMNRLSAGDVRQMVGLVAARNALASESVEVVIERTGGVPLFVEELTRAVLESGAVKPSAREIPVTLHDSLMARLDRLGSAKDALQVASVIGGEFSYELLHAVHRTSEQELESELRKITDADLLYFRGIAPEATYRFKHALIRDAAYEALLKSRRKELHRLVASTIDEKFAALKEAHPEVLARHWTEAGETEPAIAEWTRAGKAAEARNAFIEAQESLQQALALLNLVPESQERDVRELKLRQSLRNMIHVTRGWAAPEAAEAAERIGLLAQRSGDLWLLVESMTGRCFQALIVGALSNAAALADEALELARREGNPTSLALLHVQQLMVHFFRGDLAGAEGYFTTGLKFFDDPGFRRNPVGSAIAFFGWASWTAWMLGRADVACERLAKIRLAVNPANPHDLAWSATHEANLRVLMRENESAEAMAARALELCEKHRFPSVAADSRCALGHARAQLGHAADGIALIRQGIDTWVQIKHRIRVPLYITSLAAAQLRVGAIGDALETVEQALNFNPEEVVGRPETLRIRGEVRLKLGDLRLAEADFRDSIAMARSMGAKAWELRTTMSLAQLLASQGSHDEAYAMLTDIYNRFTEGFDTADLKEAKALLDELSD